MDNTFNSTFILTQMELDMLYYVSQFFNEFKMFENKIALQINLQKRSRKSAPFIKR